MNIILFGPPGAGKGTQSNKIVNLFNLHKVSTGDLLRQEAKNETILGDKIKLLIDKGSLVPDEIINNLIVNILLNKSLFNRLIFDGYPRTLSQAKTLDQLLNNHNQKISCVLSLEVDEKIVIKRILGRQTCTKCGLIFNKYFNPSTKSNHSCDSKFLEKRSDDNEKTVVKRYQTYLDKTLPILDFYKDQNLLHQINGDDDINQIFEEIRAIITSLEA